MSHLLPRGPIPKPGSPQWCPPGRNAVKTPGRCRCDGRRSAHRPAPGARVTVFCQSCERRSPRTAVRPQVFILGLWVPAPGQAPCRALLGVKPTSILEDSINFFANSGKVLSYLFGKTHIHGRGKEGSFLFPLSIVLFNSILQVPCLATTDMA